MRSVLALVRAGWQTAASYRLRLVLSILALTFTVVPVYFVANALQPMMADTIAGQGTEYFGFLIVGMATFLLLPVAVRALPDSIGSGLRTGIFDALLGTPARLPSILAGLVGFDLLWALLRLAVLLAAAWLLGAHVAWERIAPAALVLLLIVASYVPFGLFAGALVLAFRTSGPLPQGVLALSALLGGVYYPTDVIPSWIRTVSNFVPLTYGLRALRTVLLEGAPFSAARLDIVLLLAMTALLLVAATLTFAAALRYARRAGTLTQY